MIVNIINTLSLKISILWHDNGIRLCECGCGWVPLRGFLCLFWRENHTKGWRARFPIRPKEDEGRQGPNRAVGRRNQSTEEGRTDQDSQQKRTEKGSRPKREVKRAGACGLRGRGDQRERMSQRSWWLCGNFARIHARDSSQKHRMLGKCHKLLPSCTWS